MWSEVIVVAPAMAVDLIHQAVEDVNRLFPEWAWYQPELLGRHVVLLGSWSGADGQPGRQEDAFAVWTPPDSTLGTPFKVRLFTEEETRG